LRGDILLYAAHAIPDLLRRGVVDAKIAENGHLWRENS